MPCRFGKRSALSTDRQFVHAAPPVVSATSLRTSRVVLAHVVSRRIPAIQQRSRLKPSWSNWTCFRSGPFENRPSDLAHPLYLLSQCGEHVEVIRFVDEAGRNDVGLVFKGADESTHRHAFKKPFAFIVRNSDDTHCGFHKAPATLQQNASSFSVALRVYIRNWRKQP